jgi:hypothetical protein
MSEKPKKLEQSLFERLFEVLGKLLIIWIIILAVLSIVGLFYTYNNVETFYLYLIREVSIGVLITSIIAGLLRWFFNKQFIKELKLLESIKETQMSQELREIKKDIENQSFQITEYSMSLDAMSKSGVSRFYSNRSEASEDINKSIKSSLAKGNQIMVIGISLNEFTRDEDDIMHDAWNTIESYIKGEQNPKGDELLNIRALIIDPNSKGGHLRANAERQNDKITRLNLDVKKAIGDFSELQELTEKNAKVNFAAKLYRTSPILYMVWTPDAAFVQQYYYRPRHHKAEIRIPVLKYIPKAGTTEFKIHKELKFHFDWIWQETSISLKKYEIEKSIGTFQAMNKANIKNIFYEYSTSKERIIHLINSCNEELLIKGISLNSYFQYDALTHTLFAACERGVKVKILLIDPICEQANIRSFREYKVFEDNASFNNFVQNPELIREQRLYKDTLGSLKTIKNLYKELEKGENHKNLEVRKYFSAPEAFMLITDTTMIIEQYHYGKIPKNTYRTILGGDVPLVEYKDNSDIINPYKIYKDHFNFVLKHYSEEIDFEKLPPT